MALASPARLPPLAKLLAGAGFRDLECPQMHASGFPGFPAEAAPLVCGYDHFLALLGWCDHVGRAADRGAVRRSCGHGPDIAVEVAGGKFMSAFVRAAEA